MKSLKSNLGKTDVKPWRDKHAKGAFADNFAHLDGLNPEALRTSCGEEDLKSIEGKLLPLIDAAASVSKSGSPDVQQLSTDKQMVETGKAVIAAEEEVAAAARAETLVSFINSLEQAIREEIRLRPQTVIDEISMHISAMWAILHPTKVIENVRLYIPEDADKAIDIGLMFHGAEQESPRFTLSEG